MVISARQGWHDDMFIPALSCNIVYHLSYLLGTLSNWRFFHIINPSVYDCEIHDCQNVSNMCIYFSGPMPGIYKYRGANFRPWTIEATLLAMELPIMVTVVPRDGIDELVSSRRNEAYGMFRWRQRQGDMPVASAGGRWCQKHLKRRHIYFEWAPLLKPSPAPVDWTGLSLVRVMALGAKPLP